MAIRILIDESRSGDLASEDDLGALYTAPDPWLRANMVTTIDGSATGTDGKAGTINNAIDREVFALLRRQADAIIVGAGTARTEGYHPTDRPIVVVSHSGQVPQRLSAEPDSVLLATRTGAPALAEAREAIGDRILLLGDDEVDLTRLRPALAERGLTRLLSEGGPSLLADLIRTRQLDELCCTVVPAVVAGEHRRILAGPPVDAKLRLSTLIASDDEHGTTLLCRWLLTR